MDDTSPSAPQFASSVHNAMSYACMYFPPTAVPRGTAPYPMPTPFLDIGDFMLCENVVDGIALGHLYNTKEEHALAVQRDKMIPGFTLSRRPKARKFAVDLSVSNLEIIEFAWMEDHSLIIACRRLDQPVGPGLGDELVLSGDLLFYDVIPPGDAPDVPLLRMTLCEKPAICQFCGTRGIKTCACPATFKTRAPTVQTVPVPLAHGPFSKMEDTSLRIVPQGPLAGILATWDCYTNRIFSVNTSGAFFVHWYRRSPDGSGMSLFMSPAHPVSYQFVCGTRKQTMSLATMYVKRMKLCERAYSADARLYGCLSRGSDLNMLMDKRNASPSPDDLLGLTDSNSYFETNRRSPNSCYDADFDIPVCATPDPTSVGDSSSTNPSLDSDASKDFSLLNANLYSRELDMTPKSTGTSTTFSGDSSGLSQGDAGCHSGFDFENMRKGDPMMDAVVPSRDMSPNNKSKHVMDSVFESWEAGGHGVPQNSNANVGRNQKLTLSTTSRELQQYMTVDASNTPTCQECGSSFPKRGNLARHIQTVHLKLKPFQCEHCSASFGYKNHLKRHQVVHQRGSEFKCRVCSREFRGQLQLTRHIQQAHQQGSSDSRSDVRSDDAERSRVSCDICGVSFSQKSNLSRHRLIHEGMRFVCPVCPSKTSFGQRYDLHRHILRKHPDFPDSAVLSLSPQRVERVERVE